MNTGGVRTLDWYTQQIFRQVVPPMAERSSLKPAPASVATLTPQGLQAGKPPMPLGRPFTLIGSRNRSHLHLLSSTISRNHACIITTDNGLYLRDLASRTGVTVNGRRVKEMDLRDGDVIGIGSFKFKFSDPAGPVRFPLTPKASPAMLEIDGTTLTPLDTRSLLIGRRPNCDVPLEEESVSNSHALIFESNGHRFIRDLGSRTGILVNGKPVHHELLEFGDQIRIGETNFRYISAEPRHEEPEGAETQSHELDEREPIGLHFADEHPAAAASNGEGKYLRQAAPADEDEAAPIPLAGEEEEASATEVEPEPVGLVGAAAPDLIDEQPAATDTAAPDDDHRLTAPIEPAEVGEDSGLDFAMIESQRHIATETAADRWESPIPQEATHDDILGPADEITLEPPTPEPVTATPREQDDGPIPIADLEPEPAVIDAAPIETATAHVESNAKDLTPELDVAAEAPPAEEPSSITAAFADVEPPDVATDSTAGTAEIPSGPAEPEPPVATPARARSGGRKKSAGRGGRSSRRQQRNPEPADVEAKAESALSEAGAAEAETDLPPEMPAAFTETPTPIDPIPAPPAEMRSVTADVADVVETTEPTPESALSIEPQLRDAEEEVLPPPQQEEPASGVALSDTAFGLAVQEFTGRELGPLVEEAAVTPAAAVQESSPAPPAALPSAGQNEPQEPVQVWEQAGYAEESAPVEPPEAGFEADVADAPAGTGLTPWAQVEAPVAHDLTPIESAPPAESDSALDWDSLPEQPAEELIRDTHLHSASAEPQAADPHIGGHEPVESHFTVTPYAAPLEDPALTSDSIPALGSQGVESVESVESLETSGLDAPQTQWDAPDAGEPVSEPVAPPPPAAVDPFFGMERDLGSFIGGMPLPLASDAAAEPYGEVQQPADEEPAPDWPEPSPAVATTDVAAPAEAGSARELTGFVPGEEPTLTFSNEPEGLPPLDESLLADPEPLELFDESGEKLDALPDKVEPIDDLNSVLEEPSGNAAPPPKPAAAPSRQPATPPAKPPVLPVAKAKPAVAPPPPRRGPLRSLTGAVGVGPARGPQPFGGAPAAPGGFPAHGTVSRSPLRATDVFSKTAFPGANEAFFGTPPGDVSIPPMTRKAAEAAAKRGAAPGGQLARARQDAIPPNRQAVTRRPSVPQAPGAPHGSVLPAGLPPSPPARRPWYRRLGVLLSLMIAAILIVILIVLLLPTHHLIQGTLQIKGMEKMNVYAQRQQARYIRNMIAHPEVRQVAIANLGARNVAPGWVQDPGSLDALTRPENAPFDEARNALVFTRSSADVAHDRPRLLALLTALYAEMQSNNDRAASARRKLEEAQARLDDLERQRADQEERSTRLSSQISAAGGAGEIELQDPRSALAILQQRDLEFHQELTQAADRVSQRREALQQAQAAAAKPDAAGTQQIGQLRQTIAELGARLEAARLVRSGKTDQAAKAFESALNQFERQLTAVPQDTADPHLASYVAHARELADQIRTLDNRLVSRQRDDAETVAQLRRQLTDRREARLRQVWSADGKLKEMLEERNAQAHRYSAALDSGYSVEATKIKGVLDDLDQKIDARRKSLATGGQYSDELQQKLQQTIDQMQQSQQQDEQGIADKLKLLQAAAPDTAALPAVQQEAAGRLIAAASATASARRTYAEAAALSAADADAQARKLQAQLADQQARLESLLQQGQGSQPSVKAAGRALEIAQEQAATASAAYLSNHALLGAVRELADVRGRSAELAESLRAARDEVEQRKSDAEKIAVIQQPDENSVAVIYGQDQRLTYLLSALFGVVALFIIPLWQSFSDSRHPKPIAVAEQFDVMGHPVDDYAASTDFDTDEHPAAV